MPETTHTPAGNYPKSAPVHHLDLQAEADRLIGQLAGRKRQTVSLAREKGVSLLLMAMEAGDSLNEHSADGVVLVQALRGRVTLAANGERIALAPGEIILFQPGVHHDLKADEQSVVLLTVGGGNE